MIDRDEAEQIIDQARPMRTEHGDDLGPVLRVFLDEYTGWPSFATINHATVPGRETFVALHEANLGNDTVVVPYSVEKISGAVSVAGTDDLSTAEEDDLFDYYGVPIDGVAPIIEHLGSALVPADDGVAEVATDRSSESSSH